MLRVARRQALKFLPKLCSASILEAIPDAVAAVNRQGLIIQVNSQAEAMFGYKRGRKSFTRALAELHRP